MADIKYKRVVLKLSGEALAGEAGHGINPPEIRKVAEEIKEVHSKDTNEIQKSISHRRCGSKYNHDHNHQTAAFLTAPVKFVHECGNTGFHQGNSAGQGCK